MFVVSNELNGIVKLLSIPKQNASLGCGDRGRGRSIIGGGGGGAHAHIFVFTDCKNNRFQKKLMMHNTNI